MELAIGLTVFAFLMFVCLLSSKLSSRLNMPFLLLFLVVGMVAGSEGLGMLPFDNAIVANGLGSIALSVILFSGGFDTDWESIKSVFITGGILSSIGVLLTASFTGLFVWGISLWLLPDKHLPFSWCLLLGAIVSSTDAAAVFSILRSRSVSLKGKIQSLLEFESGSNDPMAAFLTVFMTGIVAAEMGKTGGNNLAVYWTIIPSFLLKMSIGIAIGWAIGFGAVWLFNKIDFEYNGLYYVLGVVVCLISFSLPELIHGNGFMGVYVAGMAMGNRRFVFHNGVGRFYDGLAWMMQMVLFSMLGLLAFPSQVWDAKWLGLLIALFLMVFARPLATFIGMWKSQFTIPERVLVSWVGLRGGAPIMLATFPLLNNQVLYSNLMFNIVFFIVITSVLLQGMTIMPMAKLLKLDAPLRKSPRIPLSTEETGDTNMISREIEVTGGVDKKSLAESNLPGGALVLLIRRLDKIIIPKGDTTLEIGDILTVLGTPEAVSACMNTFSRKN